MAQFKLEKSKLLFERSKRVVPGGVHSPVRAFKGVKGIPPFIKSGNGVYLEDVDGNTYIDYCMSWGPLIFGHNDVEVSENVKSALSNGWTFGAAEELSLELAELMTSSLEFVDKVRFVSSGTEAVMSAIRLAKGATGRDHILKFDGCYHGHVDSLLVKAGSGLTEMTAPDSLGISNATASETLVNPLDDDEALERVFLHKGSQIAAAIIEPIPANNGLLPQRIEFLKKLRSLCTKYGVQLIFDEVISGFRVAFGGMAELTKIAPDLVTYGKIIGGGFPVGAYGGKKELMDLIAPSGTVYQAGTLSAHPIAITAGLTTLKKLKNNPPYAYLEKQTAKLSSQILEIAQEFNSLSFHCQTFGSLFWNVFGLTSEFSIRRIDSIPETQKEFFPKLFHSLLSRGIYLAPSAFEVGFLSTKHDDEINSQFIEKFRAAVADLN